MDCAEIIKAYLDVLKDKFTIESTDSGCIIFTPYLDPSNDPLSIFIEKVEDHFRISDMTQSFEYLFLHGMEIKQNSKQKWYLNTTLNRLGINLAINELFVDVKKEEIPEGILRLTEAMRSIESLILTAKVRKYTDFGEEVASWLNENRIPFLKSQEYTGASGSLINVDFVIDRIEHPELPAFLYPLHSESPGYAKQLANRTVVAWFDLKNAGFQFYSMIILDDILGEDLWATSYGLLKTYTNKVVFWEDREKLIETLV